MNKDKRGRAAVALKKINQTVEFSACTSEHRRTRRSAWWEVKNSFVMARIVASPTRGVLRGGWSAVVLIASHTVCGQPGARSRLASYAYAGQPGYNDGLIESVFGDGTGRRLSAAPINRPRQSIRKRIRLRAGSRAERAERAPVSPTAFPTAAGSGCCDTARAQRPAGARLLPVGACATGARRRAGSRLLPASAGAIRSRAACADIRLAGGSASAGAGASRPAICRVGVARTAPRLAISAGGLSDCGRAAGANRSAVHGSVTPRSRFRTIQPTPASYRTAAAQPVQPGAQYAGSAPPQQVRGLSRRIIRWPPLPKPARIRSPARSATAGPAAACVRIHNATAAGLCVSRRRPTLRRPMGTWRSSSRSIRAMSVK